MKKDKKWLKKEISKRDKGTIYTCDLMCLINILDEPEVLSQEFIDEQRELETKIQELIESYKQEEGAYSNPENGWISGFIEDLKNLVEEEQKYYVDLDTAAYVAKWKDNDRVDIYTDGISGSDEFEFHLTEEEIKNYDPRYWPFAVKIEEMEE